MMRLINNFLSGCLIILPFANNSLMAQKPCKCLSKEYCDSIIRLDTSKKISCPETVQLQAITALSYYPELSNTQITFRFRKRVTPLSSRPRLLSVFKPKQNRKYVITISTKSNYKLSSILFKNLPYNAQIGVIGHELAHIIDFNNKSSVGLLRLFTKLSRSHFVDSFEFNTDLICIQHGLGYQLCDWSRFVRRALNIKEWKGKSGDYDNQLNQRYMNPETIETFIKSIKIYQNI